MTLKLITRGLKCKNFFELGRRHCKTLQVKIKIELLNLRSRTNEVPKMLKKSLPLYFFFSLILQFSSFSVAQNQETFTPLLRTSYKTIFNHLLRSDVDPGVVIASPSQQNPNYFYHWVRDAGLTMMEMVELYQLPLSTEKKAFIENLIQNWINFEIRNQKTALLKSNLGEPIFKVDGSLYPFPWGRPQNDGPAIRALAMIHYAFELLKQNRKSEALRLFRAEFPAETPIKRDLEYISLRWRDSNFDLWEETNGDHFFTRMAQRAALIQGAQLALLLQDPFASKHYTETAQVIESEILHHLNSNKNYIVPTLNLVEDSKGKKSEIDSSVILAVLYFNIDDDFLSLHHPYVLKTSIKIEETFKQIYSINAFTYTHDESIEPAIGRYPEDVYDGSGFSEGNPWFITTNAFAEYYCRRASQESNETKILNLRKKGLGFLKRTLLHSSKEGSMSEQFHRQNGYMQGANDLTWSYVSFIRAYRSCYSSTHISRWLPFTANRSETE